MTQVHTQEKTLIDVLPQFVLVVVDFCLLNLAFFLVYYWKRGSLDFSGGYGQLLVAFYGIWLVVSLVNKKFRLREYGGLIPGLWKVARSGVYLTYLVALMVVLMGLYAFSRGQVFGTSVVFVALECALLAGVYGLWKKKNGDAQKEAFGVKRPSRLSWRLMTADFVMVGISFFIVNYFKRGGFHSPPEYEKLLLLVYGLWFLCSLGTRKFERLEYVNFYHGLWPWIKAVVLMGLSLGLILFLFRFQYFSRTQVFAPLLLLMGLEMVMYRVYLERRQNIRKAADIESGEAVAGFLQQEPLSIETDLAALKRTLFLPAQEWLRDTVLKDNPKLFSLIDRSMKLESILRVETTIGVSRRAFDVGTVGERYTRLFINLEKLNDARYMNRYLLGVYQFLISGGYLVGYIHTIKTHRQWMFQKFPRLIAHALYAADFVANRVCPKLPWAKQIYFMLTKGKNRIVSRAEMLGRLSFCGFDIVADEEIDKRFFFIARKTMMVSRSESPTYGPLVKLDRTGLGGAPITVYKFRTMHPYSEFLQKYVFEKNSLREGGKFQDDFRITAWGKFMRKTWLDELPMLCNWLRGDLKFFGVRPLSSHYLSLYDDALQEMRKKVKPGLVPPFYADMPKTFEEICGSERRYLEQYSKKPLRTQVVYFWKAVKNILFKGARSK